MKIFHSDITCGESCWTAQEDTCHCSCGGRNHGCLRTPEGQRPVRTAKIDGFRYELKAIGGREVHSEAEKLNKAAGCKEVIAGYHYQWRETDKGAPARVKMASKAQMDKWPELAAYRGKHRYFDPTYLLWVKAEAQSAQV